MRTQQLRRIGIALVVIVAVLGLLVAVWYFLLVDWEKVRSQDMAAEARSRVQVGMSLTAAEAQMTGAWHHDTCRYGSYSFQLFYFGSHNLEKVGVVALRTTGTGNQETVTEVDGIENYMLHIYAPCSSLDLTSTRGKW